MPADADLMREEIFGPVAPITTFSDDDKAVQMANDTEYGLVAYAYTTDLGRMIRVSEALEFGMVGINQGIVSNPAAPFGGVKALRLRPRGRPRGHRRVPLGEVRRHRPLTARPPDHGLCPYLSPSFRGNNARVTPERVAGRVLRPLRSPRVGGSTVSA